MSYSLLIHALLTVILVSIVLIVILVFLFKRHRKDTIIINNLKNGQKSLNDYYTVQNKQKVENDKKEQLVKNMTDEEATNAISSIISDNNSKIGSK